MGSDVIHFQSAPEYKHTAQQQKQQLKQKNREKAKLFLSFYFYEAGWYGINDLNNTKADTQRAHTQVQLEI